MPSTYSDALRLELIANGEQTGNWGNTTNRNLGDLIEQSITGVTTVDVTSGNKTLLALNGALDEARSPVLVVLGTPTGALIVTVPNAQKQYVVKNNTTVAVTVNTAGGTGYVCPAKSTSQVIVEVVGAGLVTGTTITDIMAAVLKATSLADALGDLGAAPLESPVFTGNPTAPTAIAGSNTTQIATTAFVLANGVPPKMIMFWPEATIPSGYRVCDGSLGTPDLRNRAPFGAGTLGAVGAYGGLANSTLPFHSHGGSTGSTNPDHTHSFTTNAAGEHTHTYSEMHGGIGIASGGSHRYDIGNTGSAGNHTHAGTTNGTNATHAHSIPAEGVSPVNTNYPPYYLGHWVQKI